MNIFEQLRESHDIQRALCKQLIATRGDVAKRQSLFLQLKIELEAHAAAEERFLYIPLLMTDAGLSDSRHALAEHHEIEELCEELSVSDKSGSKWLETAKKLSEEVRHHLKEEEKKFFQLAGKLLSDKEKEALAKRYQKDVVRMRKKYADEYQSVEVGKDGNVQAVAKKAATKTTSVKSPVKAKKVAAAATPKKAAPKAKSAASPKKKSK